MVERILHSPHHEPTSKTWQMISVALVSVIATIGFQWVTLGFSTPSREEVSKQIQEVKSEADNRINSMDAKLDAIQQDIEQLKIQAERTSTLLEASRSKR